MRGKYYLISISRSLVKSQWFSFSTWTTPQGYCRALTFLLPTLTNQKLVLRLLTNQRLTLMNSLLPTTAKGRWLLLSLLASATVSSSRGNW